MGSWGVQTASKSAYVIYEWYLKVAHVVRKVGASGLVWVNVIEAFIDDDVNWVLKIRCFGLSS